MFLCECQKDESPGTYDYFGVVLLKLFLHESFYVCICMFEFTSLLPSTTHFCLFYKFMQEKKLR